MARHSLFTLPFIALATLIVTSASAAAFVFSRGIFQQVEVQAARAATIEVAAVTATEAASRTVIRVTVPDAIAQTQSETQGVTRNALQPVLPNIIPMHPAMDIPVTYAPTVTTESQLVNEAREMMSPAHSTRTPEPVGVITPLPLLIEPTSTPTPAPPEPTSTPTPYVITLVAPSATPQPTLTATT